MPKTAFRLTEDNTQKAYLLISKDELTALLYDERTVEDLRQFLEKRYERDFPIPVQIVIEGEDDLYNEIYNDVQGMF